MSFEKNKKIKQTLAETRKRREFQKCFVFKTKINKHKLNAMQREQIDRLFLEAKWFYNYAINFMQTHKLSELDIKVKSVTTLDKNKQPVERNFTALKSSYKQGIKDKIGDSLNALHQLKQNGHKVGRLKFKKEINCINLKQFGITHRIKSLHRVELQGFKQSFYVYGLDQFYTNPNAEIANAQLLRKNGEYYIHWTVYIDKKHIPSIEKNGKTIGIDFGCATAFSLSDGRKIDFKLQETESMRKLHKKMARQKKDSKQYKKSCELLRKKYDKLGKIKDDFANKFVKELKSYDKVVIQDENLKCWHKGSHGKAVQYSVLGRVKSRLKKLPNTHMLSRFAPTTKLCFNCCEIHKDIMLWDRVFECECGVSMDRDVHAAQCMVWMAENGYDNILLKKKKQNTAGRGDVEKQTSTVKGYNGNIIAEPCCSSGDSKFVRQFVSVKHETNRSLDHG
jgi:transposase